MEDLTGCGPDDREILQFIEPKLVQQRKIRALFEEYYVPPAAERLCVLNPDGPTIGHKLDSETRSVRGFHRATDIVLAENRMILCDTPGFGDVDGKQHQVENALLISHERDALRHC